MRVCVCVFNIITYIRTRVCALIQANLEASDQVQVSSSAAYHILLEHGLLLNSEIIALVKLAGH